MRKKTNLDAFAGSLKEKMRDRQMSAIDLSDEAGLDESYISRLLRGKRRPSLGVVIKLAWLFGLKYTELNQWFEYTGHYVPEKKRVPNAKE